MKHLNRLTFAQQKFLRALRDEEVLLPDVLLSLNIKPSLLARWFRRRYFRESLAGMRREICALWFLELETLARRATKTLREMLDNKETANGAVMAICRAILEDYHRAVQRRRRRNNRKKSRSPLSFERDMIHPSMKHREKEVLAMLGGKSK